MQTITLLPTMLQAFLDSLPAEALPAAPRPRRSAAPAVRPCRHCQTGKRCRPRGLCWHCYYSPGIRDRYPSTSKYGNRGPGNFNRAEPPLPTPTDALPGTRAKVRILEERAALGQQLFHPDDATG